MKKILLLSFFITALSLTGFAQGSNGLVAHWDFNGTTNDVSGHGLNGSSVATTFGAGYTNNPGKAIYFNGSTSKMNVPYDPIMDLDSFSICALVKPSNFYSGLCEVNTIICKGHESSGEYYDLRFMDNVYDQACGTFSPNNEYYTAGAHGASVTPLGNWINNNPTVQLNQWYCLTATYDRDSVKLYIDGIFKVGLKHQDNYSPSNSGISIGYYAAGIAGGYPYYYNGYMDDIRLYNRPLSAQEAGMYCDSAKMIPTTVAEIPENEELLLYPNPATKSITVQVPENWKDVSYTLQSGMGQQVQAQKLTGKTNSIDMESLPAGIYMIRFTAGDKIITRKIVKQ